ncbi:Rpn family recombination-promoting nuclease/putative transposase, partial [Salmonella enterica]|nr:Rpn family recombination-promoting nuclease/putative transposase [Salmonella enterica]
NAGEAPAADFMRALAERLPQHEDELMTIAQQLEQKARMEGIQIGEKKGRMEGIQIGEEKGRNEGKLEGKLEVARTMLQNGLDRNTVMKMTGLTVDDLSQISH